MLLGGGLRSQSAFLVINLFSASILSLNSVQMK